MPELVPKIHAEEEGDGDIVRDERGRVPAAAEEHLPIREQDDDDGPYEAPPGGERRELAVPREVLDVDPLGFQAVAESDSGETDAEPVEHSRDGAHV